MEQNRANPPSPSLQRSRRGWRRWTNWRGGCDRSNLEELIAGMQKHTLWGGPRGRGLRPWADDQERLAAIGHGDFLINGFRNRDLQPILYGDQTEATSERWKRSARISRKLRMLRAHGIVRKVPRTHRYHVTDTGRAILVAVLTAARTSVHQINQLAKAA
jgi:hypothetical protein